MPRLDSLRLHGNPENQPQSRKAIVRYACLAKYSEGTSHILAGDLRRAARILAKAPGFALGALLAIVLGVTSATVEPDQRSADPFAAIRKCG